MLIIYYLIYCSICQDLWKMNRLKVHALNTCHFGLFSTVIGNSGNNGLLTPNPIEFPFKAGDHFFISRIFSNFEALGLYTITMISQHFFLVFKQAQTTTRTVLQLLLYIQNFELVFAKKDFDALLNHH